EKEVKSIIAAGPLPREVGEILADRILRAGDVLGAADMLRAIEAPSSDPGLPQTLAGELLMDRGFLEEAKDLFFEAIGKDPASRAHLGLAEVMANARNWKAAAASALEYVNNHAREVAGILRLGEYLEKSGQLGEATRRLEGAAKIRKSTDQLYPALARAYRRLGDRDKAVETFRKAVSLNPGDVPLSYELGTLLDEIGASKEAEKILGSAARRSRGAPYVSHYLAYIWAKLEKNLPEAEASAREAVAADPEVGAYHAVLGIVLLTSGKEGDAEEAFSKALTCDPDPFVHRLYGDFLAKTGRMTEAVKYWRKAIDLDPRLEELLEEKIKEAGR
ncbi:MAG: tetratricopeptide repeat protein, partial [Planctomycetota bacterium]